MDKPFQYLSICAWTGPILLLLTLIFWGVLGENIPPYSADLTADQFKAAFSAEATKIRTGMVVTVTFGTFYFVWGLAISKVMEVIEFENRQNNVMSTMQLWGAGFTTLIFIIPCSIWLTCTFRPETLEASTLQILFDFGWMLFDLAYSLTTLQMVAFGVGFLNDRRAQPLVPKWVCWFTIWVGLMFIIEVLNPFFKSGPFSRSGMMNYWIEFTIFFLFMAIDSYYIIRAIKRLEAEHAGNRGMARAEPAQGHYSPA